VTERTMTDDVPADRAPVGNPGGVDRSPPGGVAGAVVAGGPPVDLATPAAGASAQLLVPEARRVRGSLWRSVLPPVLTFGIVIGVWYFVSYRLLKPSRRFLLPPPQQVVREGFLTWRNLHQILVGLALTARAAGIGFVIATVIGMALAILMSQAKAIERSVYPYAVILQTIPILAVVPVIGFAFGFNFRSRVLVCVLISLFPIITNTLFGLLSVDHGQHDLFTLYRAGRWKRLWKLQLPAALPNIFTGLRISAGLSVIGAVVGDFFFVQWPPGIGILISEYGNRLEPNQLYAAVIMASLLGVVTFVLVGFIAQRVIGGWHESARGRAQS
jgi:NitT/TauT family transport system permease protein